MSQEHTTTGAASEDANGGTPAPNQPLPPTPDQPLPPTPDQPLPTPPQQSGADSDGEQLTSAPPANTNDGGNEVNDADDVLTAAPPDDQEQDDGTQVRILDAEALQYDDAPESSTDAPDAANGDSAEDATDAEAAQVSPEEKGPPAVMQVDSHDNNRSDDVHENTTAATTTANTDSADEAHNDGDFDSVNLQDVCFPVGRSFSACLCEAGATELIAGQMQEDIDMLFQLERYVTARVEMDRAYAERVRETADDIKSTLDGFRSTNGPVIKAFREVLRGHSTASQYMAKKTHLAEEDVIEGVRAVIKAKQNVRDVFESSCKPINEQFTQHAEDLSELKRTLASKCKEFTVQFNKLRSLDAERNKRHYTRANARLYDLTVDTHQLFCDMCICARDGEEHAEVYFDEELPTILEGIEEQNRFLVDDVKRCLLDMHERLDYADGEMRGIASRARQYISRIDASHEYQQLMRSCDNVNRDEDCPMSRALRMQPVKDVVKATPQAGIINPDDLFFAGTTKQLLQDKCGEAEKFADDYALRVHNKEKELHEKQDSIVWLKNAPPPNDRKACDVRLGMLDSHVRGVFSERVKLASLKCNKRRNKKVATVLRSFLSEHAHEDPRDWYEIIGIGNPSVERSPSKPSLFGRFKRLTRGPSRSSVRSSARNSASDVLSSRDSEPSSPSSTLRGSSPVHGVTERHTFAGDRGALTATATAASAAANTTADGDDGACTSTPHDGSHQHHEEDYASDGYNDGTTANTAITEAVGDQQEPGRRAESIGYEETGDFEDVLEKLDQELHPTPATQDQQQQQQQQEDGDTGGLPHITQQPLPTPPSQAADNSNAAADGDVAGASRQQMPLPPTPSTPGQQDGDAGGGTPPPIPPRNAKPEPPAPAVSMSDRPLPPAPHEQEQQQRRPPAPLPESPSRSALTQRYLVSRPRKQFNTWSNEILFPIDEAVPLDQQPWFFGDISRQGSELLLENPCDFLVRFSTNKNKNILTVADSTLRPRHYVIEEHGGQYYVHTVLADSVPQLIAHYVHNRATVSSMDVYIKFPVFRMEMGDVQVWYNRELVPLRDLGKGHFGAVQLVQDSRTEKRYAVKTCTRDNLLNVKDFMREAITFSHLSHSNIARMFGVTTDQPLRIVMELCEKGALLDYLKDRHSHDPRQQLKWCQEVCDGMLYLSEQNCIHRDLAARNTLLAEDLTAKISDFGLSRMVTGNEDMYQVKFNKAMPIRWTAHEALFFERFSLKSDVWSFGVLMYEVFAGGKMPYAGYSNSEVKELVDAGQHLDNPGTTQSVYDIMLRCWIKEPTERISFRELSAALAAVESDVIGSSTS